MEFKKNATADLRKRSVFFLQIGLIVVLLLCYFLVEWKSYHPIEKASKEIVMDKLIEEEIPITVFVDRAVPPIPKAIKSDDILAIIDDSEEVPTNNIQQTVESPSIVDVVDIIEIKPKEEIEHYSFKVIEDVPIFPGYERYSNNEKRKTCMSEKISDYVNANFNRDIGNNLGLSGINKVYVMFNIDKNGNVVDIQSRAQHPKLQAEAIRVIRSLPHFEPGKQRGKPVSVSYSLPIVFQVKD